MFIHKIQLNKATYISMKKVLLLIIPLLAVLFFISQIDDNLSTEANSLIKRVTKAEESDSYLYLNGIYASENDEPKEVGRTILKEYRNQENNNSYEIVNYPESRKIPLPKGELFCSTWEDSCLDILFADDNNIGELLETHKILISRSNKFHEFSEYKTLTKPSVSEQLPPYQYILRAERLKVLNAILVYKKGNPEESIAALLNQFSDMRKSLALQDNLIGKLVFLMKLSDVIDISSVILSESNLKVGKIHSLSHDERDFDMVSARELAMSYYAFKELDRHPEIFQMGGNFPGLITRMVFKPNMTINAVVPIYLRLERLALLSPPEFVQEIENGRDIKISTSIARNYVGSTLASISPDFDEYVARFMDFDAKIVLFNHRYNLQQDFSTAENPYYENEAPKISEDKVCFRGPLVDERSLRCMRTKIL